MTHFSSCIELLDLPTPELIKELEDFKSIQPLWHPLGFVSCTLISTDSWALKIHLWPKNDRKPKTPNWEIHDHLFHIDSRVLKGTIRNIMFKETQGTSLEHYTALYNEKNSVLTPVGKFCDVQVHSDVELRAGSRYIMESGEFHQGHVKNDNLTVTLVLKSKKIAGAPRILGKPGLSGADLSPYNREFYPKDKFWSAVLSIIVEEEMEVGLRSGVVRLEIPNKNWAYMYSDEVCCLRKLLGNNFIGSEHIGSTSIAGMVSKPIIDMMVSVPTIECATSLIPVLEADGYIYRPDGSLADRVYFNKRNEIGDTHHISLTTLNSIFWNEKITFRNCLQSKPKLAEEYLKLKRELSIKFANDRKSYTKGKEKFVYDIIDMARST
jgi:GrpB-like predicted nucleotidyltransferase (UPF0157 family)